MSGIKENPAVIFNNFPHLELVGGLGLTELPSRCKVVYQALMADPKQRDPGCLNGKVLLLTSKPREVGTSGSREIFLWKDQPIYSACPDCPRFAEFSKK